MLVCFGGTKQILLKIVSILRLRMDLKTAQEAFVAMMQQISNLETKNLFLSWVDENWIKEVSPDYVFSPTTQLHPMIPLGSQLEFNDSDAQLRKIADDLREIVPLNAIFPSEQISFPSVGENADCDPSHTLHVDAFLYDEDMVDELCDTGELARNYCMDCSSHQTQPITYVSHSISRERLAYVFRALLPPIPEEATILDVGSRLGAVLYGAYVYTKCQRIVGIEMNPDLCQVQQTIINKHQFQNRIHIILGDVKEQGDVVKVSDVIILNNVFEFFVSPVLQAQIWCFLRANAKKGSLLVTIPSLADSFRYLNVGFAVEDWVREVEPHNPNITAPFDFQTETSEVKLYQVL